MLFQHSATRSLSDGLLGVFFDHGFCLVITPLGKRDTRSDPSQQTHLEPGVWLHAGSISEALRTAPSEPDATALAWRGSHGRDGQPSVVGLAKDRSVLGLTMSAYGAFVRKTPI